MTTDTKTECGICSHPDDHPHDDPEEFDFIMLGECDECDQCRADRVQRQLSRALFG